MGPRATFTSNVTLASFQPHNTEHMLGLKFHQLSKQTTRSSCGPRVVTRWEVSSSCNVRDLYAQVPGSRASVSRVRKLNERITGILNHPSGGQPSQQHQNAWKVNKKEEPLNLNKVRRGMNAILYLKKKIVIEIVIGCMATLKSNQCTTYICTLTGTNPEEEHWRCSCCSSLLSSFVLCCCDKTLARINLQRRVYFSLQFIIHLQRKPRQEIKIGT